MLDLVAQNSCTGHQRGFQGAELHVHATPELGQSPDQADRSSSGCHCDNNVGAADQRCVLKDSTSQ